MKRLSFIIATIFFSILIIGISNARVVRNGEFVTKKEARAYFASMSEFLESLTDPYQNKRLLEHLESNVGIKKIKEEAQWKIMNPTATRSNGVR